MNDQPIKTRRSLLGALRGSFLTGLVVVLPVGLTLWLTWSAIGWLDAWILPLIPAAYQPEEIVHRLFGPDVTFPLRGVGVAVFLVFTVLIGWMARGFLGRTLMGQAELLVDRVPVVRSVYGGLKQITETVFGQKEKSFDQTFLVEYPRPGVWAEGLVASKPKGEIAAKLPTDRPMIAVFVALTPFTSGILLYVPEEDTQMPAAATLDRIVVQGQHVVLALVFANGGHRNAAMAPLRFPGLQLVFLDQCLDGADRQPQQLGCIGGAAVVFRGVRCGVCLHNVFILVIKVQNSIDLNR